jgi:phage shock protein A
MFQFFRRLLNIFKSETHALLDKAEDPIKLTEQGINSLKKDLTEGLRGLAEVKALAIRNSREVENMTRAAENKEAQAILLLEKAQRGEVSQQEADRLASHALKTKDQLIVRLSTAQKNLTMYQNLVSKMENQTQTLKGKVSHYENELRTLKARSKVSKATVRLNKQLSQVDSRSTLALLEKMKAKVVEDEALAESYAEVSGLATSNVDDEVNRILGGSGDSIQALEALKQKMQLQAKNPTKNPEKRNITNSNRPLTDLEKLKAKLNEENK